MSMKFEDVFNKPRLPPEKEITIEGAYEYSQNIESFTTEELLDRTKKLREQISLLEKDRQMLYNADPLRHKYTGAGKRLDEFKRSKAGLKDSIAEHKNSLSCIGVETIKDALNSPRLMRTDEVAEYVQSKQELRKSVSGLSVYKKNVNKGLERTADKVSFRASERNDSLLNITNKVSEASSEIDGSLDALSPEYDRLLGELSKRALQLFRSKQHHGFKGGVSKEAMQKQDDFFLGKCCIECVDVYGVDAVVHMRGEELVQKITKVLKDFLLPKEVYDRVIKYLERREPYGFTEEKLAEKKLSLEQLQAQHTEVEAYLWNKFTKPLTQLYLNIEVEKTDGEKGLNVSEGTVVGYAWSYQGLDKLNTYKEQLIQLEQNLANASELFRDQNFELRMEKNRHKAGFFNFSLKKQYNQRDLYVETLEKQRDAISKNIEKLKKDIETVESTIVISKEQIDVTKCVSAEELKYYLYMHEDYGRLPSRAHSQGTIQTVKDFFTIFEQKRKKEFEKVESQEKLTKDSFIEMCMRVKGDVLKLED